MKLSVSSLQLFLERLEENPKYQLQISENYQL